MFSSILANTMLFFVAAAYMHYKNKMTADI